MKRITFALVFVFLGVLYPVLAQRSWTGINNARPAPAEIRLVSSDIQQTTIQFSLDGFFETLVRTPQGLENIISLDNGVLITERGMPDLAKLYTSIIIPDLYAMEVNIVDAQYVEFTQVAVAPSKGHFTRDIRPDDVPFTYGDVYNEDAFWPGNLAQLEEPFIMRDFRGQTVTVFPIQYNPVQQTLRVYTDITLEVKSTGLPGAEPLVRTRDQIRMESEFNKIYNRFFLNMQSAEKSYPLLSGEEGSMLIIAFDSFMDAMQPFVDWKRQTGRKTVMVSKTEAGATPAAIKAYVQNYFNDNDDFAYLLLIGDGPQIPPMSTSSGHSDNAYGFLVGNNSYNDIFVGRFSAETPAQVETQVQRMIEYERDLNEADTWLADGIGIAKNEGTGNGHNGGENDYVHMNFIRDTLLNFTYNVVTQRYDGNVPGVPNTTAADISNNINSGSGIINFCNHGSVTGWSVANYNISHVNQLTNVGKLPFIWSVACVNGNFVSNFCFAEAWMRATHDGQPTGAIGTMMSTINQPWTPPMTGQDEMVTLLAEQSIFGHQTIKRTFGGLSINGSMSMIPSHGAQGLLTHETWVLFGDPSLMVRTAAPVAFDISYNPVILIGTTSFEVQIDNAEGASVALTYFDEAEESRVIVGRAYVQDGTATVEFDVDIAEPMNLTLTVMGFNKVTYINEQIEVIPPDGPYVVLDSFQANNESGAFVYGTTVPVNVTLKNVGVDDATNVSATILIDDPYFTLNTTGAVSFGTVNTGENNTATVENAFSFTVADNVPDQYRASMVIEITDGESTWQSNMRFTAAAPKLEFLALTVVDDGQLNPGSLDPGEIADLVLQVKNTGHAASLPISVLATTSSPWLTFIQQNAQLDALAPQATGDAVFTVTASNVTPAETPATIDFAATTGQYAFADSRQIIIGQAPVYDGGDIPTTFNTSPNTSTPAGQPGVLTVTIPLGAVITGVDVEYKMTAQGGAWMSEQRSYIRCVSEGGVAEAQITNGPASNSAGTHTYNRTGLSIANGVQGGGEVTFELHPFRTWGGSGTNTQYGFVNNNSWKVIVHYEIPGLSVNFVVKDNQGNSITDAVLTFDGQVHTPGVYTVTGLEEGTFAYALTKAGYSTIHGEVEVVNSNVAIEVMMQPVFKVQFTIDDNFGNIVEGAAITIAGNTHDAGQYVIDEVGNGFHAFTIEHADYHTFTGNIFINNKDEEISVTLIHITTDVADLAEGLQVNIFPNPTRNQFSVTLQGADQGARISLTNQQGQVVESRTIDTFAKQVTFNMEGLAQGVYYLRIETSQGVQMHKVVLQ